MFVLAALPLQSAPLNSPSYPTQHNSCVQMHIKIHGQIVLVILIQRFVFHSSLTPLPLELFSSVSHTAKFMCITLRTQTNTNQNFFISSFKPLSLEPFLWSPTRPCSWHTFSCCNKLDIGNHTFL